MMLVVNLLTLLIDWVEISIRGGAKIALMIEMSNEEWTQIVLIEFSSKSLKFNLVKSRTCVFVS